MNFIINICMFVVLTLVTTANGYWEDRSPNYGKIPDWSNIVEVEGASFDKDIVDDDLCVTRIALFKYVQEFNGGIVGTNYDIDLYIVPEINRPLCKRLSINSLQLIHSGHYRVDAMDSENNTYTMQWFDLSVIPTVNDKADRLQIVQSIPDRPIDMSCPIRSEIRQSYVYSEWTYTSMLNGITRRVSHKDNAIVLRYNNTDDMVGWYTCKNVYFGQSVDYKSVLVLGWPKLLNYEFDYVVDKAGKRRYANETRKLFWKWKFNANLDLYRYTVKLYASTSSGDMHQVLNVPMDDKTYRIFSEDIQFYKIDDQFNTQFRFALVKIDYDLRNSDYASDIVVKNFYLPSCNVQVRDTRSSRISSIEITASYPKNTRVPMRVSLYLTDGRKTTYNRLRLLRKTAYRS